MKKKLMVAVALCSVHYASQANQPLYPASTKARTWGEFAKDASIATARGTFAAVVQQGAFTAGTATTIKVMEKSDFVKNHNYMAQGFAQVALQNIAALGLRQAGLHADGGQKVMLLATIFQAVKPLISPYLPSQQPKPTPPSTPSSPDTESSAPSTPSRFSWLNADNAALWLPVVAAALINADAESKAQGNQGFIPDWARNHKLFNNQVTQNIWWFLSLGTQKPTDISFAS